MTLAANTRTQLRAMVPNPGAATDFVDILDFVDGPGNRYYVDSGHASASNNNDGTSWSNPCATLDGAVGKCTASNGDIIFIAPGHTETITADSGVDIDVAGITVIGLGVGAARPTFTFTTAVTADFKLAAASTRIQNILFLSGIDATTGIVEVSAADCVVKDCEFRDSTGQATDCLITTAAADRLLIDGCRFNMAAAAGANSAIALVGTDDVIIRNCWIYGNFAVGAIDLRTTACLRLSVHDCFIWTENAADIAIVDTITASTGIIGPNLFIVLQEDAANVTEAITGATFYVMDVGVHVVNAANEKSLAINWTATSDAIV